LNDDEAFVHVSRLTPGKSSSPQSYFLGSLDAAVAVTAAPMVLPKFVVAWVAALCNAASFTTAHAIFIVTLPLIAHAVVLDLSILIGRDILIELWTFTSGKES
jgi:hypothetical protein